MNQLKAMQLAKMFGYKYVAKNKDGLWYAHKSLPEKNDSEFCPEGKSAFVYAVIAQDTSGINWEESLAEVK